MKRYQNGRTVFDANDISVLNPGRDITLPITAGQRALLEAIVGADLPDDDELAAPDSVTGGHVCQSISVIALDPHVFHDSEQANHDG